MKQTSRSRLRRRQQTRWRIPPLVLWLALLALAWYARHVLLLLFAGVLLGVLLQAISQWICDRTKLKYGWALTIVVLGLTLLFAGAVAMFGTRAVEEVSQLQDILPSALENLRTQLQETEWGKSLLRSIPSTGDLLNSANMWSQVGGVAATAANGLIALIVILFVGLYGAASPEMYCRGILRLIPLQEKTRAAEILSALVHSLRWWIIGLAITSSVVGAVAGIGLALLGIPQALALGLLAFCAELIPYFGPILAAIPAVILAWSESNNLAIWVVALYVGVHILEGYVMQPLIQRRAVALPPVLTIIAVSLFGVVGGGLGVIVATPLMLVMFLMVKMIYVEGLLERPTGMFDS